MSPVAILAGGLATRLRPLTETVPKVLLPVAGKAFLHHQLTYLSQQGVRRVVLCLGYLGEMVQKQFGDGRDFGLRLEYSFDGPVLLGTAGAIKQALPLLGSRFFVLYGDSYLPIRFDAVEEVFDVSGKLGLMTVFRNEGRWDTSNVWFEDNRIRLYDKSVRLPEMRFIDYGLSMFRAEVFDEIPAGEIRDLARVMKDLVDCGELAGYEAQHRFYEIGSQAGLTELDQYLREREGAIA